MIHGACWQGSVLRKLLPKKAVLHLQCTQQRPYSITSRCCLLCVGKAEYQEGDEAEAAALGEAVYPAAQLAGHHLAAPGRLTLQL